MRAASRPILLAAIAAQAAQAWAAPPAGSRWHCTFAEELRCDPGRACETNDSETYVTLDRAAGLYRDCSPGFCIASPAIFRATGDQLTIHVMDSVRLLNLADTLDVTEVSLIGPLAFIRRGRCTELPSEGADAEE